MGAWLGPKAELSASTRDPPGALDKGRTQMYELPSREAEQPAAVGKSSLGSCRFDLDILRIRKGTKGLSIGVYECLSLAYTIRKNDITKLWDLSSSTEDTKIPNSL